MSLPIHHVVAGAPRAVAPFSHAVEADGLVFVTGQMPTDPAAPDAPLPAGVEAQTRRVFENLKIVLGGLGLGLEHVVMARIYLSEFRRDYAALNGIWPEFWQAGKLPARTTVGVTALAVDALVEIDLVVRRP
jgi:reactive intermediate/imine deaminase